MGGSTSIISHNAQHNLSTIKPSCITVEPRQIISYYENNKMELIPKILKINDLRYTSFSHTLCFCGNAGKNFAGSFDEDEILLYFYCDNNVCIAKVTNEMSKNIINDPFNLMKKYEGLFQRNRSTHDFFGTKLIYYKYTRLKEIHLGSYIFNHQNDRIFNKYIYDVDENTKIRCDEYIACCMIDHKNKVRIFDSICSKLNIEYDSLQNMWFNCFKCGIENVCQNAFQNPIEHFFPLRNNIRANGNGIFCYKCLNAF